VGVEAIDHVQLAMPAGREEDARRFYGGLLGIPEQPKPPHLAARGGCWFETDRVKVHLGVDADFRPAKKAHPRARRSVIVDADEQRRSFAVGTNRSPNRRAQVDESFLRRLHNRP
jgi:hypothetical protein